MAHQVGPGTPHDDPSGERNLVAPSDDREGSINHPIRGRLATYMFEVSHPAPSFNGAFGFWNCIVLYCIELYVY